MTSRNDFSRYEPKYSAEERPKNAAQDCLLHTRSPVQSKASETTKKRCYEETERTAFLNLEKNRWRKKT